MKTHGLDLRTHADNAARMADKAAAREDRRKRAFAFFEREPELPTSAVAVRVGLAKSTVVELKKEWRKRGGA